MRTIVTYGLLLTLVPAAATAQNDCLKDFKMPKVGAWAEYTGTYKDKPTAMRYAVVGSETRAGKDLRWLELRVEADKPEKTMVYQMLTPGTPAEIGQVEEVVFKEGERPAMKLNSNRRPPPRDG